MKILIECSPKEIADLELALKDGKNDKNIITKYYIDGKEIARRKVKEEKIK